MNELLNSGLNRVSMYRLMSIALTVLWATAIFLSTLGILEYPPLALLMSGLVLITATTVSNLIFGRLFGVSTHNESSYITALILVFILPPLLTPTGIIALSLAGVIASASKYILAVHGRHIFNPAAVSALIIGLTGLTAPTWWVATPTLLPITLVLAFLILYKTRRLMMGLVFLCCAIPAVLVVLAADNTPLMQSIAFLPSWPFLFFVGFMLSEPLTLPPKNRQQLLEAGLVGILFSLPIQIGFLALNPAVALLVGNILALFLSYRRRITLALVGKTTLTPTSNEYTFKPTHPINFEPGQYMEVTLPHVHKDARGMRRTFSIASLPGDNLVTFGVKHFNPSSSFKRGLHELPMNAVVQGTSIGGDFTLPKDPTIPLLFIAGGIGITPFISHIKSIQKSGQARDIILLYAVSSIEEIAYRDILQESHVKVVIIAPLINSKPVKEWQYVSEPSVTEETIRSYISDVAARQAYIAGSPAMAGVIKKRLKKLNAAHITIDYFTGY